MCASSYTCQRRVAAAACWSACGEGTPDRPMMTWCNTCETSSRGLRSQQMSSQVWCLGHLCTCLLTAFQACNGCVWIAVDKGAVVGLHWLCLDRCDAMTFLPRWLDCNLLVCTSEAFMPPADHNVMWCHLCCPCLSRPVKCMVPAATLLKSHELVRLE